MKKLFTLFASVCIAAPLVAQDFALVYEPENTADYVVIRDVHKTVTGDLLAGYDYMYSTGTPAAGIMRTTADGHIIWSKTLEIPASLAGCTFEVVEKEDGNIYLWGLSKEEGTNNMRAILSEISADGDILWSKEYDFGTNLTTSYTVNKLQIMPSGDLQMMIAVYDEVIVMKTDANGEIIWGKSSAMGPPDEGGKNPGFEWLAIPDDGGMCASKAENDFSLLRYNDDGELLWNRAYKLGTYTHGKTIARSPNGNILISGFINMVPHIMEISDADGSINWVKTFEGATMMLTSKAHLAVEGDEIILDLTTNTGMQYILQLSEDGEVLQTMHTTYPVLDYNKIEAISAEENYFYGSAQIGDSFSGILHRTGSLFTETCLIQPAEAPLSTVVFEDYSEVDFTPYEADFTNQESIDVTLIDQPLRAKYACDVVLSNGMEETAEITMYPNPAANNMTLVVSEDLLNANYTVTNLAGQQVLNGQVIAMQMEVDLEQLANGQYIFAIQTEKEIITKKITVVK